MSNQPTAEHFVNAVLDAAPVAAVQAQIVEVQDAAQQLQTLHAALSPLVAGRLAFKDDESFQRVGQDLADRFLRPEASREALKPFLVKTLLKETATPEERTQLIADLAEITAGVRATVPTPSTSWAGRSEASVAGRGF